MALKTKKNSADSWFSIVVRMTHDWTCYSCHKQLPANAHNLHNAHIFSRRHNIVRWFAPNVFPGGLCAGCHMRIDEDHEEHRSLAIKALGVEAYQALNIIRRFPVKVSKADRLDIAKHYRTLVCQNPIPTPLPLPFWVAQNVYAALESEGIDRDIFIRSSKL